MLLAVIVLGLVEVPPVKAVDLIEKATAETLVEAREDPSVICIELVEELLKNKFPELT